MKLEELKSKLSDLVLKTECMKSEVIAELKVETRRIQNEIEILINEIDTLNSLPLES